MSESAPELPEIACENCVAACCKAPIYMPMSGEEYEQNVRTMDLRVIKNPAKFAQRVTLPPELGQAPMRVPADTGLYLLASGCANLTDDNRCAIHSRRPKCCRDYTLGSPACRKARRKAGLDADRPFSPEELGDSALLDDGAPSLVSEFFPQATAGAKSANAPAAAIEAPPVDALGPIELAQFRTSIARDARWISEQLSNPDASLWTRRTRCAGWDIGALAAHLVTDLRMGDAVLRAAVEGHGAESPDEFEGDRETTVRTFGPEADAICVLLDRITPAQASGEVVIDDNEALRVRDLIDAIVLELAVHGLDLAHALGEERHLTADAITVVARALPSLLSAPGAVPPKRTAYLLRSSAFEIPFTWQNKAWTADAVAKPCVIEGEPEAVLLYALGRIPFEKETLSTNRPDVARSFKRYLVGP